ncbi:hypothetical protein MRX96_009459 [Rhipicephalus microplus]
MASRLALLPRMVRQALRRPLNSASPVAGVVRFSCVRSTPAPSLLRTNAAACAVSHRRFLKSEASAKEAQEEFDESEWTTIFRYPHIRFIQMLCRFKIYQCFATFVVTPPLMLSEYAQWLPTHANATLLSLMVSSAVVLFLTGMISERIVGMMTTRTTSRTSPTSRTPARPGGRGTSSCTALAPRTTPLILTLKQGGIVDKELFTKVFGHDIPS